jgi:hypothetical protein
MPANTTPIYTDVPHVEWVNGIGTGTANTSTDGTGTLNTNIWSVFTAGSSGSYIESIRVKQVGTNIASLIRVFINNGSTNGTASNNSMIGEIATPAIAISSSANNLDQDYPIGRAIPAGYRILVTVATQVSNGFAVTTFGGDY